MEDAGKYDYKIEFVGLFVLDEDFVLGEEKTITLPHTGEEVTINTIHKKCFINEVSELKTAPYIR